MAALPNLDVATVNLWGDNGPAGARMRDLADWLRRERLDLALLQEVEDLDGSGQAHSLASAAGYAHVHAIRAGQGSVEGEGLAVLSRHPLRALGTVGLPEAPSDDPRAVHRVEVTTPVGTLLVANTHLAWRLEATDARAEQARALVQALSGDARPTLVGGDLNDVPGSPALEILEEAGFEDCCAGTPAPPATFDRGNEFLWQPELAGRRVDHLLGRGLEIVDARVVLDGAEGPVVSDHYGVRATIRARGDHEREEAPRWA